MSNRVKQERTLLITGLLFLTFLFGAFILNTNTFKIQTSYVGIDNGSYKLQGLLYKPNTVSSSNPAPGIILAHGIANSKDVVSGYALELAKRGFVSLALDESAHGNSGGNLYTARADDPSLGVTSAVNWLESQNYIKTGSIGVIGHSMGAGAVLSASLNSSIIKSTILIGGGVNGTLTESSSMNTTNPRNMLIIIGRYDVLFNIPTLKTSDLKVAFNTSSDIQENTLYGSFDSYSARELFTISATHLFEVENPEAIAKITNWLSNSLQFTIPNVNNDYSSFLLRDISLLVSFGFFIAYILVASKKLLKKDFFKAKNNSLGTENTFRGNYLLLGLTWGILSLILFLPSQLVGTVIIWPPLIFGSFFTFWQLFTVLGALILLQIFKHSKNVEFEMKVLIKNSISNYFLVIAALGIFAVMYVFTICIEEFFNLNFKLFIPVLNEIGSSARLVIFLMVLPYTIVFYFFQNVYCFSLSDYKDFKSIKTLLIQIGLLEGPFIIILIVFYLPIFLASAVLIKGTTGFFTEFLVPTTAVFIITTVINWFYYKETENIIIGTLVNALLVALTISSLFPVVQTFF